MSSITLPASFRDPSGFVFIQDDVLYRQVNRVYREDYARLVGSGLYEDLTGSGLLIPHEEVGRDEIGAETAGDDETIVIRPRRVPFISHPYEWCFGQLKDAALATLEIQRRAVDRGMVLKDASAFNIQFFDGKPLLIDTLSFARYTEGEPWVAYRQFCQHFLAPLALMSKRDVRLGGLLREHLDGIPLDLASTLLPWRTRLSFGLQLHIHLHARTQRRWADAAPPAKSRSGRFSRRAMLGLVDNLRSCVKRLSFRPDGTTWAEYYKQTNYSAAAGDHKAQLVDEFLARRRPATVWDLGANTGRFGRLAASRGAQTIAFDVDPAAVERNYRECVAEGSKNLLPLLVDLTNPTPALGWNLRERMSLVERGPADVVLALALVHHLSIGNNVPFGRLAEFFASLGRALIVEFVPKSDSQVQRLLRWREDVFADYSRERFEACFAEHFTIERTVDIRESERTLYLMQRRC